MERLEEVFGMMGERVESVEDVVPLDVAELAALELGQLAARSADAKGMYYPIICLPDPAGGCDSKSGSCFTSLYGMSTFLEEDLS